jgi:hypothetical protein
MMGDQSKKKSGILFSLSLQSSCARHNKWPWKSLLPLWNESGVAGPSIGSLLLVEGSGSLSSLDLTQNAAAQ